MEYSSTLYHMAINPNHSDFSQTAYNDNDPVYVWRDNTVYKRTSVWYRPFKRWLSLQGVTVSEDNVVYTPIATVKDGIVTGYHTEYSNIANRFLDMDKSTLEYHYPNLYYVQIGNHPYPKEGRYQIPWLISQFHRECHRIVYPDSDPTQFFILPSNILP